MAICLGEKVTAFERINETTLKVTTDRGTEHFARSILLALGAGACVPKQLDIEYDKSFDDKSIFYAVKNKEKFRDKNVLIVGGGDSAVDWGK